MHFLHVFIQPGEEQTEDAIVISWGRYKDSTSLEGSAWSQAVDVTAEC